MPPLAPAPPCSGHISRLPHEPAECTARFQRALDALDAMAPGPRAEALPATTPGASTTGSARQRRVATSRSERIFGASGPRFSPAAASARRRAGIPGSRFELPLASAVAAAVGGRARLRRRLEPSEQVWPLWGWREHRLQVWTRAARAGEAARAGGDGARREAGGPRLRGPGHGRVGENAHGHALQRLNGKTKKRG